MAPLWPQFGGLFCNPTHVHAPLSLVAYWPLSGAPTGDFRGSFRGYSGHCNLGCLDPNSSLRQFFFAIVACLHHPGESCRRGQRWHPAQTYQGRGIGDQ